ncbi:DUF6241 domain-containing protein [Oceanobacillus longus]|uniref:DUF6241 domain-containing protein n=1 Tax=Oceanobacillus longus TaxID=930120 RepID=A0ABV8GUC3_9BACI
MKKALWILGTAAVIALGVFLYMVGTTLFEAAEKAEEDDPSTEETKEVNFDAVMNGEAEEENSEEEEETEEVSADMNPFGQAIVVSDIKEDHIQGYIHNMSHQKVEASEKWGFYEITDERINWLLEAVNNGDYPNGDTYRDILERWANGDFSSVVQDHNTVWSLQDGTIGKATGILSKEEEQAFIESRK